VLERQILGAPQPLLAETVRAGQQLYYQLREREALVALLTRYLAQPLAVEEHVWARWLLVDNLALLRRHEDTVEAQRDFLAWARAHLPAERLFWVMRDSTQALSWAALCRVDEWLTIVNELFENVDAVPENRDARFNCLRTASGMLARTGRTGESLEVAARMGALADEDPLWERAFDMRAEAGSQKINAYQVAGSVGDVRRAGLEATQLVTEHVARLGGVGGISDPALRKRLATVAHNVAAPLYRGRQYDLAIPLFRLAVSLGIGGSPPLSAWPYGWLAASLWVTERDRTAVLPLLREAAARYQGTGDAFWRAVRKHPEFQDFADDPEFAAAAAIPA